MDPTARRPNDLPPPGVEPAPVVLPVTEARARIAELVGRVQHAGERVVLTKHGRAVAVLVPPADLDRLLALERGSGLDVLVSTTIAENSEVVWATLVGARSRARWWPGVHLVDHVGSEVVERDADGTVRTGEIVRLVPERLLEVERDDGTHLRVELAEHADSTTVRVVHTRWEQLPDGARLAERQCARWHLLLAAWRTVLTPA